MADANEASHDGPERTGWSVGNSDGSRSYWADDPDYPPESTAPQPVSDPQRSDALLAIDLDHEELQMLVYGLNDWGGPAYGSTALAVAMGFESIDQMSVEAVHLMSSIEAGRPLSLRDWTRALVATEFAFVSEVFGTGPDEWTAINGGRAAQWLGTLQRLQLKVPHDSEALPD